MGQKLAFDSHFLHGVRSEQGLDLGPDGSLEPQQDDMVVFADDPVDQQAVHRGAVAINHFFLHHSALEPLHVELDFFP